MSTFSASDVPTAQTGDATLVVETGDEAAEIFVIDSQFNRVARSLGERAEFKLPRGLYSVKIRVGMEYQEKPVILGNDDTITFDRTEFLSSAPLADTAKTHEFQEQNAQNHSRNIHERLGEGSQIYVFVRDWTSKTPPNETESTPQHPGRGLTLRDQKGKILIDYGDSSWPHHLDWDPWSTCNVAIDPGLYRLRLETAAGERIEQTIVASPDWQTQVFLLQRSYDSQTNDRRADLASASVFVIRPGAGFDASWSYDKTPDQPDFRLTEMACQGLANYRRVLSKDVINRILDSKFGNPMLGIYGAHLLLLEDKPDREMLRKVVSHLRELLGQSHPDVEALALKSEQQSEYRFDFPPLLQRSWALILKASIKNPKLIPYRSLAYRVAGHLLSGEPWLLWLQSSADKHGTKMLRTELNRLLEVESDTSGIPMEPPEENVVSESAFPDRNLPATAESNKEEGFYESSRKQPDAELSEDEIIRLVQALSIPRSKLTRLLRNRKA